VGRPWRVRFPADQRRAHAYAMRILNS
jgi:hypothetical protein